MKSKITLLIVLAHASFASMAQQVPNSGFEAWSNAYTPVSWTSAEDLLGETSSVFTYKDSLDFIEGTASIKLVSDSIPLQPQFGVLSAETSLGTITLNGHTTTLSGVPYTYRPDSFIFAYKYSSPGLDTATAEIALTKNQSTTVLRQKVLLPIQSTWTYFAVPLTLLYDTTVTPDTIVIQFKSSTKTPVKGSTLHIDAVRFAFVAVSGVFNAVISPAGPVNICTGDSIILQANTGNGYTYQWQVGGNSMFGATRSSLIVKTSGSYTVIIDSAGVNATSQAVLVTVNQPPTVTLTGLNDTVCNNSGTITLSGGSPFGGTYSGPGVIGNTFSPQSANVGVNTIVYSLGSNNCAGSASATITVTHAAITLTGLNDTICSNANAITLSGGSPTGGQYAGSGVTSSTFTPQSATVGLNTITYTATDASNCTGSASATIYVEVCGGINNITANEFSIYPNPATNVLNVTYNENASGLAIKIYDMVGHLVVNQTLTGTATTINITNLSEGTYLYRIADKENLVFSQGKFDVLK